MINFNGRNIMTVIFGKLKNPILGVKTPILKEGNRRYKISFKIRFPYKSVGGINKFMPITITPMQLGIRNQQFRSAPTKFDMKLPEDSYTITGTWNLLEQILLKKRNNKDVLYEDRTLEVNSTEKLTFLTPNEIRMDNPNSYELYDIKIKEV